MILDDQLKEYLANINQKVSQKDCIIRRNMKFELQDIPENMVDIVKLYSDTTLKYRSIFRCLYEDCNLIFKKSCNIRDHFRQHINSKPFVCEYCNRSFSQKGNLKKHL